MSVENDPSEQDCYHRAAHGEPRFTLLGRDPAAPAAIEVWRMMRAHIHFKDARYGALITEAVDLSFAHNKVISPMDAKSVGAHKIAENMRKWLAMPRSERGLLDLIDRLEQALLGQPHRVGNVGGVDLYKCLLDACLIAGRPCRLKAENGYYSLA